MFGNAGYKFNFLDDIILGFLDNIFLGKNSLEVI